jgi:hypothetical protein
MMTTVAITPELSSGCRDQTQIVIADTNVVAGVQLSAPARLGLVVDQNPLGCEEPLDLATAVHDPGELQQLAEPDHLTANRDLTGHPANLAPGEEAHDIFPVRL